MQLRRAIGGLGWALLAGGALILLFVVYQLWGTKLAEVRNQDALRHQLSGNVRSANGAAAPTPNFPPPIEGAPIAIIQIPRIGTNKVVVQGVSTDDLHKGPGHYATTVMPGQLGNAAIAAHRTTFGAPFYDLDKIHNGDQVLVTTNQGRFVYTVFRSIVVAPADTSVLDPTPQPQLTLTTCTPRFSAAQRLVVMASLAGPAIAAPPPPRLPVGGNLAGGQGSWWPACLWGVVVGTLVASALFVARRWRPGLTYVIATPLVLAALFVFFESVSPLLPASI
jgi:sortase A